MLRLRKKSRQGSVNLQDGGMKVSLGFFLVFFPIVVGAEVIPPSLKALVESSVMKPASIGVFVVPLEG